MAYVRTSIDKIPPFTMNLRVRESLSAHRYHGQGSISQLQPCYSPSQHLPQKLKKLGRKRSTSARTHIQYSHEYHARPSLRRYSPRRAPKGYDVLSPVASGPFEADIDSASNNRSQGTAANYSDGKDNLLQLPLANAQNAEKSKSELSKIRVSDFFASFAIESPEPVPYDTQVEEDLFDVSSAPNSANMQDAQQSFLIHDDSSDSKSIFNESAMSDTADIIHPLSYPSSPASDN